MTSLASGVWSDVGLSDERRWSRCCCHIDERWAVGSGQRANHVRTTSGSSGCTMATCSSLLHAQQPTPLHVDASTSEADGTHQPTTPHLQSLTRSPGARGSQLGQLGPCSLQPSGRLVNLPTGCPSAPPTASRQHGLPARRSHQYTSNPSLAQLNTPSHESGTVTTALSLTILPTVRLRLVNNAVSPCSGVVVSTDPRLLRRLAFIELTRWAAHRLAYSRSRLTQNPNRSWRHLLLQPPHPSTTLLCLLPSSPHHLLRMRYSRSVQRRPPHQKLLASRHPLQSCDQSIIRSPASRSAQTSSPLPTPNSPRPAPKLSSRPPHNANNRI